MEVLRAGILELEREAASGNGSGKGREDALRNAEQLRGQWDRAQRMLGEEGKEIEECVLLSSLGFRLAVSTSCVLIPGNLMHHTLPVPSSLPLYEPPAGPDASFTPIPTSKGKDVRFDDGTPYRDEPSSSRTPTPPPFDAGEEVQTQRQMMDGTPQLSTLYL